MHSRQCWTSKNALDQSTHSYPHGENVELGSDLKLDEKAKLQIDWIAEQEQLSSNFSSSEENGVGNDSRGSTRERDYAFFNDNIDTSWRNQVSSIYLWKICR